MGELKIRDKLLSRLDRMLGPGQDPYPYLDAGRRRYLNRELRRYQQDIKGNGYEFWALGELTYVLRSLIRENGLIPVMLHLNQQYHQELIGYLNGVLPNNLGSMLSLTASDLEEQLINMLARMQPDSDGQFRISLRHSMAIIPEQEIIYARTYCQVSS